MRARVIITAAAIVAVLALGALARTWFAPPDAQRDDKVFAGSYTSDTDLRVTNLTILGGHVTVAYSLDVLFEPSSGPAELRCGLVDTSGRLDFFGGSQTVAQSGTWTHLEYASNYDLPDLTLGVRCSPSSDGVMSIAFRRIELTAVPVA